MKHPMQTQHEDSTGVIRFTENKLITWLIDQLPNGLNSLAIESQENEYDDADYDQILQQIGYSVSGIPYRNMELYDITDSEKWENPELIHHDLYKDLKDKLRPIMSDLYNKAEEDMS